MIDRPNISGGRTPIGLKRMGEIELRPFLNVCEVRFPHLQRQKSRPWNCAPCGKRGCRIQIGFPFKIVMLEGGNHQVCIMNIILSPHAFMFWLFASSFCHSLYLKFPRAGGGSFLCER